MQGEVVAEVQIRQILQPGQGAQIVDAGGLQLGIAELGAGRQRAHIAPVAHGQHHRLQIRHVADEVDALHVGVVAQIQVLDLGAVLERLGVLRRQLAADAGVGGEDALHIRADAVAGAALQRVAEPDAPDHVGLGMGVPDLGHVLVIHTAAVHIQVAELRHAVGDRLDQRPLIVHGDVGQVHLLAVQAELLVKEGEGIVHLQLRPVCAQPGQRFPGDRARRRVARAQLQGFEIGQERRPGEGLFHRLPIRAGQVDLLRVLVAALPVQRDVKEKTHIRAQRLQLPQRLRAQRVGIYARFLQICQLRQALPQLIQALIREIHLRLSPVDDDLLGGFRRRRRLGRRGGKRPAAAQQRNAQQRRQADANHFLCHMKKYLLTYQAGIVKRVSQWH